MEVQFQVIRQQQNSQPRLENYQLEVDPGNTILDCLNLIKWELDGTLAFRKNCRNTICGSCGMRINGRATLACKENIAGELARCGTNAVTGLPEMTIAPLGNLPVIKDLIVDLQNFWQDLEAIEPYISTGSRQVPEREFLQTPEERSQLEATGNCIMCGACYSDCNAKEVNPDFVGPHALAKAYRMIADQRDGETASRLETQNQGTDGVWGCTRCSMCNTVCPMGVNPMDQISKIKQEVLAQQPVEANVEASRAIRHRRTLVELVKDGGWIDERKFGLQVMGNSFRDWQGLLSLGSLGLRMLAKGKFPLAFDASEGTDEVRSLIEAVRSHNLNQDIKEEGRATQSGEDL